METASMSLLFAYGSILAALLSGVTALAAERRLPLQRVINRMLRANILRHRAAVLLPHVDALFEPVRYHARVREAVFALLGASGVAAVLAGASALAGGVVAKDTLPFGLPWLAWHVRVDKLSGFFFALVGVGVIAVSLYGPGYVREYQHNRHPLSVLGLFTGLFVAGMELVLAADDAFFFVIAWELMSVASYFLVAFQHEHAANRRAAFLYLLMAEIGAIAIIVSFGVLAGFAGGYTFDLMRAVHLAGFWPSIAFLMALIGFGMKAGLVPIHAWLPEAHPVAPSHISALMSGVMLKVAVYGFVRFSFDLLGEVQWQWGLLLLLLGTASAVLGILYAIQQQNLKRLLAYSSIENIGIIFMGLGLSMIFFGTGYPRFGALGLIAALYHALNHSVFKSLLFLAAGSVLHQTHEHDIEHMGGLIRRMPKTAAIFLVGCISLSALPPFNGFVSEWLTFQTALQAHFLGNGVLRSVMPVAAAVLALTGALAVACFVKVFGIVFLGQPRTTHLQHTHEVASRGMLAGPAFLAVLCFLLGVLPKPVIGGLEALTGQLTGYALRDTAEHSWLWLTPVSPEVSSYSAPLVLLAIVLSFGAVYWMVHRRGAAVRRAEPWDCGFGGLNHRMQYTSASFSMPFRRIFAPVWDVREDIKVEAEDIRGYPRISGISYQLEINDRSWRRLYTPIAGWVEAAARLVGRIQTGNIRTYLAYSFFTLIILLGVIS
jgi:hydrogenase-4 component B